MKELKTDKRSKKAKLKITQIKVWTRKWKH